MRCIIEGLFPLMPIVTHDKDRRWTQAGQARVRLGRLTRKVFIMGRAEEGYRRICEVGIPGEVDDVVVIVREGI